MVYQIFEGNMERLEKKLTRIFNKCKAYGCDFRYEQVGETFRELKDEQGNLYTARFVLVEAEGTALVNDWEFVASVEHTEKGNIISGLGKYEVPERYYSGKSICEHCKSNRYRKATFIVRNKVTGEFKQVGKSCLNDFTNGLSAEVVTRYTSLFETLIQGETPEPGCYGEVYLLKEEYLVYVAETIRHFGYVRTQDDGRTTASRAMDYMDAAHGRAWSRKLLSDLQEEMEKVNFNPQSPETIQLVKDALDWVAVQGEDNNYFHNLKTACSLNYITRKNFGLLASLFPAYNKELEKQDKQKAVQAVESSSEYVGEVKDRIIVKAKSVKCVTSWETDFGITRIYKIIGEDSNVYTWKTGTFINEDAPEISITGTVKAHTEYRGIKQTELTRCRVAA